MIFVVGPRSLNGNIYWTNKEGIPLWELAQEYLRENLDQQGSDEIEMVNEFLEREEDNNGI